MVSRPQKQRMSAFIAARIGDAGLSDILHADASSILIAQKKDIVPDPAKLRIFLHADKLPIDEYQRQKRQSLSEGVKVSNIFYKDGTNFHVRLGQRSNTKGRERSLKNYSKDQLDKMIHLRGLEKAVLEDQSEDVLVYYQPNTFLLPESMRGYLMGEVELDYSHIDRYDPAYSFVPYNKTSVDYKLAEETFTTQKGIIFVENGRLFTPKPSDRTTSSRK